MRFQPKNQDGMLKHHLLTVSDRGWIKKFHAESGKVIQQVEPEEDGMSYDAIDYTNFGEYFVVGGTTQIPKLYDDITF